MPFRNMGISSFSIAVSIFGKCSQMDVNKEVENSLLAAAASDDRSAAMAAEMLAEPYTDMQ